MPSKLTTACLLAALGAATPVLAAAGFVRTAPMASPRADVPVVTLPDGSVLVASDSALERFDPASRSFRHAGALATSRGTGFTMTLLSNGKVLIVGGEIYAASLETAEIFDPATGRSAATGSLRRPRSFHAATLLADGRVLITGGRPASSPNSTQDTAEIYDPVRSAFELLEPMSARRQVHTATRLADGRVLVAGGYDGTGTGLASAELFDPDTGQFTATGSMAAGRGSHTASLLPSGKVVVVGGHAGVPMPSLDGAEIYDPVAGSFAPAGTMSVPRGGHTATPLPDGTLLIAGGFTAFPYLGAVLASAEIYDPEAATFAPSASLHAARGRHAAAPLSGGAVLVAGGLGPCCGSLSSAEVFSPWVVDKTPPVVTVPADITVPQQGPQGAVVVFEATAFDLVDVAPLLSCEPPSGSTFPVGVTTVVCTATDSSGNQAAASFRVTVVPPLDVEITIDPTGKVDPRTGLATLRGSVSCNRTTQRGITLEVSQGTGPNAAQGSATRGFTCAPPSLDWILSVSAASGRFHAGYVQARVSGEFCDPYGCDAASAEAPVRLRARVANGGEFPLAKVVDTRTPMPRSRSRFGSLGLPFVRNATVVFQGYGPTLSESGLYASSGRRLKVVADTATPVPGGAGPFTSFDSPAFDGVTLVFQGQSASGGFGLYASRGDLLIKVANALSPVPGGAGTFGGFVGPVVTGNVVAFRGSTEPSAAGSFGVYVGNGIALGLIADTRTPVPGGAGTFGIFGNRPLIDGDTVVFPAWAAGSSHAGIFSSRHGVLSALADTSTAVPGGTGNFRFFGPPAIDGDRVAFTAFDASSRPGIYETTSGVLGKVADTRTTVPGRQARFGSFGNPVVGDGVVAFSALTTEFGTAGLYASRGAGLITLADVLTPVPGGQGVFSAFGTGPLLAGDRVAFLGVDTTGTQGIYVRIDGTLHEVISTTDTLDGKAVGLLQLATGDTCDYYGCPGGYGSGFDGSRVAFLATFADGTQGIYVAFVGARR